jgi:signal transduction histidine kinase
VPSGAGDPTESGVAAEDQLRRVEVVVFLAIRVVHVVQGAIAVSAGRSSFHSDGVAFGVLGGGVVETALIARIDLRANRHGPGPAIADTVFSVVGLVAIAAATPPSARTTSLNWMLPYAVGAAVGVGFAMANLRGAALSGIVAVTYLATTWSAVEAGGGPAATALSNAISVPAFFVVVAYTSRSAMTFARRFDHTRQVVVERERQLAIEEEQGRHQRLIHDSVLQSLEAIASGRAGGLNETRAAARAQAVELRALLAERSPTSLRSELERLSVDHDIARTLVVHVVADEDLPEPTAAVTGALIGAAREALINCSKHSGAERAVLRLHGDDDGGVQVVITDQGKGFDPAVTGEGFGMSHSIRARIAEVGGRVEVWSSPGCGTRISLWGPLR